MAVAQCRLRQMAYWVIEDGHKVDVLVSLGKCFSFAQERLSNLKNPFESVCVFQIELQFASVGF